LIDRVSPKRRNRSRSDPIYPKDRLDVGIGSDETEDMEENNHICNGWSMQHYFKSNATRCKSY
jgi:hypothetical protein